MFPIKRTVFLCTVTVHKNTVRLIGKIEYLLHHFFLLFHNILSDCHYSDVINSLLNAFRLKKMQSPQSDSTPWTLTLPPSLSTLKLDVINRHSPKRELKHGVPVSKIQIRYIPLMLRIYHLFQ